MTEARLRPTKRDPLESVQILRAVAALSVLFAHLWPTLLYFGITDAIPNFIFGAAGVDLFFVISGFIMVYTSEPLFARPGGSLQFFMRRLVRIVPLYWGLTFASLIGRQWLPSHADLTWNNIVGSFLFIPTTRPDGGITPALSVGWTLNYEMLFYLLFAGAVLLPRRQAVLALNAVIFALVSAPFFFNEPLSTPWSVWTSPFLCEFAFGTWIGAAYLEGWRIRLGLCIPMMVGGFLLMVYAYNSDFITVSRAIGWGIGSASILAAVVLANATRKVPAALGSLVAIGDASYALYLVHTLVPPTLLLLRVPVVVNPANWPISYCAIVVVVALAAAFVLNFFDQKIRARLVSRIGKTFAQRNAKQSV